MVILLMDELPDKKMNVPGGWSSSLFCDVCEIHCPAEYQMKQHLAGRKHRSKCGSNLVSSPANSNLFCDLCQVSFPSLYQQKQHIGGKKHLKNLRFHSASMISSTRPHDDE